MTAMIANRQSSTNTPLLAHRHRWTIRRDSLVTNVLTVITIITLTSVVTAFQSRTTLPPSPLRRKFTPASITATPISRQVTQYHVPFLNSKHRLSCTTRLALTTKRNGAEVNTGISNTSTTLLKSTKEPDVTTVNKSNDAIPDHIYKTALTNTLGTITFSFFFGLAIWYYIGPIPSQEFFAGYLVEQSLSLDNLFVFLLLFEYFKVPLEYQNRVLTWGIIGAVVMRGIMISLGSVALKNFHSVLLLFAAVLVYSSGKMIYDLSGLGRDEDDEEDMASNSIVRFSRSLFPTTDVYDGDRFFSVRDGIKSATPLLLCLISVEISDVVFAVDSVPAVFGVTEDPFIVFTSNICAILGLRSLYTILSKAASDLQYLEPAVAVVLGFIGAKLIGEYFGLLIPTELSLLIVASLLFVGVGASILFPEGNSSIEENATSELNLEQKDK